MFFVCMVLIAATGGLLWLCRPRGDRPAIRGEFIETIVGVTITAGLASRPRLICAVGSAGLMPQADQGCNPEGEPDGKGTYQENPPFAFPDYLPIGRRLQLGSGFVRHS
jgi:hypothetical protein